MSRRVSRRRFLQTTAAAGAASLLNRSLPAQEKKLSASDKLAIGMIGLTNQAEYDLNEVAQAGVAIGAVRNTKTFDVPKGLDWDLWLGPAPARPYVPDAYHRFNWRQWWDFGGGTLADMACHHMDLSFWALKLRHPTRVMAWGAPPQHE